VAANSENLSRIARVFEQTFGADPKTVVLGAGPDDIDGWDSLGHVSMVSRLEKTFGLSFDVDEVMEMESVDAILSILERHKV
jgi:acyl carrier protein